MSQCTLSVVKEWGTRGETERRDVEELHDSKRQKRQILAMLGVTGVIVASINRLSLERMKTRLQRIETAAQRQKTTFEDISHILHVCSFFIPHGHDKLSHQLSSLQVTRDDLQSVGKALAQLQRKDIQNDFFMKVTNLNIHSIHGKPKCNLTSDCSSVRQHAR